MADLFEPGTITTAAVGRPFTLGMLYDCRSDKLIPGVTLWNNETLKKHIDDQTKECSRYRIFTSDKIQDKANALNVHGSLKLTMLFDIFTFSGSAEYFKDMTETDQKSRVTLKYESTSKYQQLTMDHLPSENLTYPHVFDQRTATHVVTAIEYGSDAFFIFEKNVSSSKSREEVDRELRAAVTKIVSNFDAGASLESQDSEDFHSKNVTCQFYGDFKLDTIPSTYSEAWICLKSLAEKLKTTESVPKLVHLYPLDKLDSHAARLVRDISDNLIDKVQHYFQLLVDCKIQATTLAQKEVCCKFLFLKHELEEFQHMINLSTVTIQKGISQMIPKIKGGSCEETQLVKLLEQWEECSFHPSNITLVLKSIVFTVSFIENCIKHYGKGRIKLVFGEELMDLTFHTSTVVCFTLNTSVLENKGLKQIEKNVYCANTEQMKKTATEKEWFDVDNNRSGMRQRFLNFARYAELNQQNEEESRLKIAYVITESAERKTANPAYVQVFQEGQPSMLDLPSHPEALKQPDNDQQITKSSVELVWSEPDVGAAAVSGYRVRFCEASTREKHNDYKETVGPLTQTEITGLKPGTMYAFNVQAVSAAGFSQFSNQKDVVATTLSDDRLAIKLLKQSSPVQDKEECVEIYCPNQRDICGSETVQKVEIGKRHPGNPRRKTILIVGESGVGKTTLINSAFNYLCDVHSSDDFRFKIITQDDEGQESAQSKTQVVTGYVLNQTRLDYVLTLVDTPGFGATEGLARDKQIIKMIKQLFEMGGEKGIDSLDAVCIIVKAPDTRLTPKQKHIFQSVLSLFGEDMKDNILIMATFADATKPPVKNALIEGNVPFKSLLKFNNSAVFEKFTEENRGAQEFYWEIAQESFKSFFSCLSCMKPVSIALSKEVLQQREDLENYVLQMHQYIRCAQENLNQMRTEGIVMEKFEGEINANKNFKYSVQEYQVTKVDKEPGIHTTNCLQCNRTCHEDCTIADDSKKLHCWAMDKNKDKNEDVYSRNCRICKDIRDKTCPWSVHKNLPYVFDEELVTVERTLEEMREKYLKATSNYNDKDNMMETLGEMFGEQQLKILDAIHKIRIALNKLREIAMQPSYMTDVDYIDTLIDVEQTDHKPGWQDRVAHLKDQRDIAKNIQEVQDPNYDPFEKERKEKDGWVKYAKKKISQFWHGLF